MGLRRSDLSAPSYRSLNRSYVAADISISVVVGVADAGDSVSRPGGLHCAVGDADGASDDGLWNFDCVGNAGADGTESGVTADGDVHANCRHSCGC